MPTRMGGYLNGLIFLMFLLSIGYSNNLLLIFTLVLFGFNLLWLIQTHYYLSGMRPGFIQLEDSFAFESSQLKIQWQSQVDRSAGLQLALESGEHTYLVRDHWVSFPTRGVLNFEHLKVATEMPFGLYQAWIYLPIKLEAYVYPERLKEVPPINGARANNEGGLTSYTKGVHDFSGLNPYQNDESKRISWKHYARSGDLLIKEGEEAQSTEIHFVLHPDVPDKEVILSEMATQMVYCQQQEMVFSLQTPFAQIRSGIGQEHLQKCLRELCRC